MAALKTYGGDPLHREDYRKRTTASKVRTLGESGFVAFCDAPEDIPLVLANAQGVDTQGFHQKRDGKLVVWTGTHFRRSELPTDRFLYMPLNQYKREIAENDK